ncbi:MAG: 3-dehydroquinate synthase [Gammaproteobacteria bacterium]|nr:3-dehydroquinate synthase [Gammaproteobacteria bacterium]
MQIINTTHYPIYLGHDIAHRAFDESIQHHVLICDDHIKGLYAEHFFKLASLHLSIPAGEQSKTRAVKESLEDQMLAHACHKQTQIFALGGGVITDLAGFLAATYYRGVDFISIPTSLLAMVDSSIGGKTAVNTPWGKNLIGQFYFPKNVWIDLAFLKTLPSEEFSNGMAEVIKHAALFDSDYWEFLTSEFENILNMSLDALMTMIKRSIELKHEIVTRDPFEKKERALLNFGHTIAHGIESASDYTIKHGEAVAYGMILEAYILNRPLDKLIKCLKQYGLLQHGQLDGLDWEQCITAIAHDKKNRDGEIYLVNWQDIAVVELPISVTIHQIEKAFLVLKELI